MLEHWKPVVGWEGVYAVSNLGRVRRERGAEIGDYQRTRSDRIGQIVGGETTQYGYHRITLCDGKRRARLWAHRIVLAAFVGPRPSSKHTANHKDGNKLNNRPDNLEWVTIAENNRHSRDVLGNSHQGDNHPRCVLSDADCKRIYRDVKSAKWSMETIAAKYGTDKGTVGKIATGKARKHLGLEPITGHRLRKLSVNNVPTIRTAYANGASLDTLAARYKVHRATIYDVVNRRRWASVP